jgi:orotidine-5'-phosphate decarboxylase
MLSGANSNDEMQVYPDHFSCHLLQPSPAVGSIIKSPPLRKAHRSHYLRAMTRQELVQQIQKKKSYLCVGLDTDIEKIPQHLRSHPDAVFEFNKQVIDATHDLCVSYKINTAFYEALGLKGWEAMDKTVRYIGNEHFKIADAKRGDIGNTSTQYAKAFFEAMPFDSITVAPYMGEDSVKPFLDYEGKWAIVLGLTSNKGSHDFQKLGLFNSAAGGNVLNHAGIPGTVPPQELLYERVMTTVAAWGSSGNIMFVVGATQADDFTNIRRILPDHFFLVPGVGAQGGSLKEISEKAMLRNDVGLLVNASRAIIYASPNRDFAEEARAIAQQYQYEMAGYLS